MGSKRGFLRISAARASAPARFGRVVWNEAPGPAMRPETLQLLQRVGELVAVEPLGAPREHAPGHRRVHLLAEERLLVADVQVDRDVHRLAAVALGEECHLHRPELQDLRAPVDVVLGRVEGLGPVRRGLRLEALHGLRRGGRWRDRGALRVLGGNEEARGAVVAPEVGLRRARHVLGGDPVEVLLRLEEEPPVAQRDVVRELHAEGLGIGERLVDLIAEGEAHAVHLLLRGRRVAEVLDHALERRARGLDRLPLLHDGAEDHEPRVVPGERVAEDLGGEALLDDLLVQPARGHVAEDEAGEVDVVGLVGEARGDVVRLGNDLDVALAAHLHLARAVLRRLDRPEHGAVEVRLRDAPERLRDERERLLRVELAGDEQHRVVGLVVHVVEALQVRDRHVLDVAAVADRGARVGVPVVGHALQALEQHLEGRVLPLLVLVAHHRHLAVEVAPGDERADHAVALERDRPRQVVVARPEDVVVVGAVEPGGAVEAHATLVELAVDVRVVRRALEHHVLEQVRHARLAVVLEAAADEVGDVDRDRGLRGVREEQHLEAVGQAVLGDALDFVDLADRRDRDRRPELDRVGGVPRAGGGAARSDMLAAGGLGASRGGRRLAGPGGRRHLRRRAGHRRGRIAGARARGHRRRLLRRVGDLVALVLAARGLAGATLGRLGRGGGRRRLGGVALRHLSGGGPGGGGLGGGGLGGGGLGSGGLGGGGEGRRGSRRRAARGGSVGGRASGIGVGLGWRAPRRARGLRLPGPTAYRGCVSKV